MVNEGRKRGRGGKYIFQHLHFRAHTLKLDIVLAFELREHRVGVLSSILPPYKLASFFYPPLSQVTPPSTTLLPAKSNPPRIRRRCPESPIHTPTPTRPCTTTSRTRVSTTISAAGIAVATGGRRTGGAVTVAGVVLEEGGAGVALVEGGGGESAGGVRWERGRFVRLRWRGWWPGYLDAMVWCGDAGSEEGGGCGRVAFCGDRSGRRAGFLCLDLGKASAEDFCQTNFDGYEGE